MISDEYEEEYYIVINKELRQIELRLFTKNDRLVFAQKYDETSAFNFKDAMELCENLKRVLDQDDEEDFKEE